MPYACVTLLAYLTASNTSAVERVSYVHNGRVAAARTQGVAAGVSERTAAEAEPPDPCVARLAIMSGLVSKIAFNARKAGAAPPHGATPASTVSARA